MKKIIAIIILQTVLLFVQGQSDAAYESFFGQQLTDWTVSWTMHYPHISDNDTIWYHSYIDTQLFYVDEENDSVFVGYRPIGRGGILGSNTPLEMFANEEAGTDYLRESSDHSRLYLRLAGCPERELLVLDLNLSKGDTFYLPVFGEYDGRMSGRYYVNDFEYLPKVVDSVYYANGRKHVRLDLRAHLIDSWRYLEFIEGVGPSFSVYYPILHPRFYDKSVLSMNCYTKDSIEVWWSPFYHDDTESSCFRYLRESVGVGQTVSSAISVYPNPTDGRFTVEGLPEEGCSISVYNALGTHVLQTTTRETFIQLNLSHLPRHVYTVVILSNSCLRKVNIIKQ